MGPPGSSVSSPRPPPPQLQNDGETGPSLPSSEKENEKWTGPAKMRSVVNGLTFRSDFDSGNLMRVLPPAVEHEEAGGVYRLWTARDCEGQASQKRNSSWFYFAVAGGSKNQTITMRLMNLNNQNGLYKHGMTPVFKVAGSARWSRLRQKVAFEEDGRHLQLQFRYRFTRDAEEVFFAFCFPHSVEDCQRDLESFEDQARRNGMAVRPLLTPKPGPTGYYHRELLIRTPGGRRVDLITITDCHGITDEREPTLGPHVFPNASSYERPLEFEGKDVVFVSARVHPGETPSSFVMQGILRREPIVIIGKLVSQLNESLFSCTRTLSLVPMLNPDGVAAGHFRQDLYGNNLNRHYVDPHPEIHAPVFGAKAVVMHYASRPQGRGRLTLYLDLHAHASMRGCFMYGNHLPGLEDQAENQLLPLLMTCNTPHFDFASCNFSLKHMSRVDSGDDGLSAEGTGRVFYGRHAGIIRSYTLECNYNTGKGMCNAIPRAYGSRGAQYASPERNQAPPPKYHPEIWRDVGRGFLKALLDAEGISLWSRLPLSKFRSLERAREFLLNDLRSQLPYREQSLQLRRRMSSSSGPAPSPLPSKASTLLLPPTADPTELRGLPSQGSSRRDTTIAIIPPLTAASHSRDANEDDDLRDGAVLSTAKGFDAARQPDPRVHPSLRQRSDILPSRLGVTEEGGILSLGSCHPTGSNNRASWTSPGSVRDATSTKNRRGTSVGGDKRELGRWQALRPEQAISLRSGNLRRASARVPRRIDIGGPGDGSPSDSRSRATRSRWKRQMDPAMDGGRQQLEGVEPTYPVPPVPLATASPAKPIRLPSSPALASPPQHQHQQHEEQEQVTVLPARKGSGTQHHADPGWQT